MADKKGFNLAEALSAVSVPDLGTAPDSREQIEYIDIDLIVDDPNNFYELSAIDELAANIELLGLQQPIRVRPDPTDPAKVMIVSGHRRRAAIRKLVEEGRTDLREIPCIREKAEGSVALQELRLIYANSDTRHLSSAEISKQAERVEALLYQLKEEGYEFPGRMRDHVAEACKVSKSKLSRLKVIRDGLIPEAKKAWEAGRLNEAAAYALSQHPADIQRSVWEASAGQVISEYSVKKRCETIKKIRDRKCKKKHDHCTHQGMMEVKCVEHFGANTYADCEWYECCELCSRLTTCKDVCVECSAARAKKQAERSAAREQEKAATRSAIDQLGQLWSRFGQARAAASASVEDCEHALGRSYYKELDDGKYAKYESGQKITEKTSLPYGPYFRIDDAQRLIHIADLLDCSLDYLFCRTDEPGGPALQPEGQLTISGWFSGEMLPMEVTDAVADFDLGDPITGINRMICHFDGTQFCFKRGGVTIDMRPLRWLPIPPVPEEVQCG